MEKKKDIEEIEVIEGIDGMLHRMLVQNQNQNNTKKRRWLHPIGSESLRPDVIEYLFACADEGVNEDDCVKKLSNIFYHDSENVCEKCKQNEKKIFEAAILFAYRTLKEYKELLNAKKNEKDNLTDNSPCAVAE